MIDGGVVTGYVLAFLGGAAKRFLDSRIDGGLSSLYDRLVRRLGERVVRDVANRPGDPRARGRFAQEVEYAASQDPRFAHELAAIVDQLDRAGGRVLINQVHPSNYSRAPVWVKAVTVLGAFLALGGMVWLVVDVVTAMTSGQDEFGRPLPPSLEDLTRGAILFACGLFFLIAGSLGRSMSRSGW